MKLMNKLLCDKLLFNMADVDSNDLYESIEQNKYVYSIRCKSNMINWVGFVRSPCFLSSPLSHNLHMTRLDAEWMDKDLF